MILIGHTKFKDHGGPSLRRPFWDDGRKSSLFLPPRWVASCRRTLASCSIMQLFTVSFASFLSVLQGQCDGCLWKVGKKRCNYRHAQKQLPALTIRMVLDRRHSPLARMVLDRRHSLVTRPEKSIYCGILQCHHYVRWFLFGKCNWFTPYKICNYKILTFGIDLIVTMQKARDPHHPECEWNTQIMQNNQSSQLKYS